MRSHASDARRHPPARSQPPRLTPVALRLVPLLAVAAAAVGGLVFPAASGAQSVTEQECIAPTPGARGVARSPVAVDLATVVSARGEETGRRLVFGPRRGGKVAVELPVESFVVGPFDDRLIYGLHRPDAGSEVRALSLDSGCDMRLAQPAGIARSAVPDGTGLSLYVHTVTEDGERRDAGITRIELATGAHSTAVAPFIPDEEFGLVFSTQLAWADDGRLVVQSCGYRACQTRVADLETGEVATHTAAHGMLVAVTASELVAFAAEHDRPTQLLAIDLATGEVRTIADEVFDAELARDGDRPRLMIETPAGWQEVLE